MSDDRPVVFDDDNPEWTEQDFARAKPLSEFPELQAALTRRPGRPVGSTTSDRQQVALRIPKPVLDHFKAGGRGWQTRMIDVLEREVVARHRELLQPIYDEAIAAGEAHLSRDARRGKRATRPAS